MGDSLAGVVLAAGAGRRLAPLTSLRPKPLCPVGNVALVDHALDRITPFVESTAVNLHHGAAAIDAHLPARVHRSFEDVALGTAGALALLQPWIDGRDVLVTNADAWFGPGLELASFVGDWDRRHSRLLCVEDPARGDFGTLRYSGVALLAAADLAGLVAEPTGLYEVLWREQSAVVQLDLVTHDAPFVDCGTVADYLRANLLASDGATVIDPGAQIEPGAVLKRCVVWDHTRVGANEVLVDAVRADGLTVLVR